MTLVEAVEHVQAHLAHEGCKELGALRQLRMACGEGEIPLRWAADEISFQIVGVGEGEAPIRWTAEEERLPFEVPEELLQTGLPPLFSPDEVPTDPLFWDQALIINGRVIDQRMSEADAAPDRVPRPRELFLLRSRILELWPLQGDTRPNAEGAGTGSSRPEPRRQKREPDEIRQAARDLYEESPNDPPNISKAEQEIRRRLPGADRDTIRDELKKEEFASRRRRRGNQPNR
jgi:hypothetical protein